MTVVWWSMLSVVCAASASTADGGALGSLELNSRFYDVSRPVEGSVQLDVERVESNTAVVFRWMDAYGRELRETEPYRLDRPGRLGEDLAFSIPLTGATSTLNHLQAVLMSTKDGREIHRLATDFTITSLEPRWDRYRILAGSVTDDPNLMKVARTLGAATSAAEGAEAGVVVRGVVADLLELYAHDCTWSKLLERYKAAPSNTAALIRQPSLDDPLTLAYGMALTQQAVWLNKGYAPFYYHLANAPGVGNGGRPLDIGFGPHTLKRFREDLKTTYKTLDALNGQWQTRFETWDDVMPMTVDRIVGRTGGRINLSGWSDHRTSMDDVLAGFLTRMRETVEVIDEAGPVGVDRLGAPSPYGWDYWKLTHAIDVLGYDSAGCNRALLDSFRLPRHRFLRHVDLTSESATRQVWRGWLDGDHGVEVDAGSVGTATPDSRLIAALERLKGGLGRLLFHAKRDDTTVAIVHSQASLRARWLMEVAPHGERWLDVARDAIDSSIGARNIVGWQMLAEDLHWPYRFVDVAQIETGILDYLKCNIVVLPQSYALGPETVKAIRRFAERGGLVIADALPAVMDAHGKMLEQGQLDGLFGVTAGSMTQPLTESQVDVSQNRRWVSLTGGTLKAPVCATDVTVKAGHAAALSDAAPCVVINKTGNGWAVLLNMLVGTYPKQRTEPESGAQLRGLIQELAAGLVGMRPSFAVQGVDDQPAWPIRLTVWKAGAMAYFGLMDNLQDDSPHGLSSSTVRLDVTQEGHVYDVIAGSYLGKMRNVEVTVSPDEPVVLAALPYQVEQMQVSIAESVTQGEVLMVSIQLTGTPRVVGHHVVDVLWEDPKGKPAPFVPRSIIARRGRGVLQIPIALNEMPGRWQLRVVDVVSGTTVTKSVKVMPRAPVTFPKPIVWPELN